MNLWLKIPKQDRGLRWWSKPEDNEGEKRYIRKSLGIMEGLGFYRGERMLISMTLKGGIPKRGYKLRLGGGGQL